MKNFLIGGKILLTIILFVASITIVSAITPSSGGGSGGGGSSPVVSPIPNFTGQTVVLSPGWNTFSTPKILDSITFQSGGTGLYFYSLTSTGWQTIVPTKDTIKPLEGFMINNTNLTDSIISLTYKQNPTPLEMIFQKQLHVGWNILGITTMYSPFSTIGAGGTMAVDFTRNSNGSTNYANKVTSDFYSKIGDISLGELLLGESYGIFMQSPVFYAGVQNPNSGTNNPPPTTTGSILTGSLSISLNGTAGAQYVPQNAANVKVGSIRLLAGSSNVTIQSLVVSRSGLGNASGIISTNGVRAAQNGIVISSTSDYFDPSTQKATIYFSPALVIASGSSQVVDILVNLSGSSNSQHQFTLTAVNTSGVIATGTPITLGLLNTTSYQVATIDVTEFTTNTVTSNKSQQLFGTIKFVAGSKDATLNGFTLSKISGINIPNALTNVKVYKYGTQIGTVSITNDQIYITGLNIKIPSGSLLTLELRGDTVYIGDGSTTDDITLDISNRSDVSATEDTTGYSLAANINTTSSTIDLLPNHIMLTKNSTASKVVVPGASNVELLNINITSNSVFDITSFTLDGISGLLNTNNDTEETAQFTSLTFTVNGVDYDLLNTTQNGGTGTYTFATSADKFRVESGMPVNVRVVGNVKSTASIGVSYIFALTLNTAKNIGNGQAISLVGKTITGDRTSIASPILITKGSSVAAPSASKIYSNASNLEIGRFGLEAKSEDITVREITLTNTAAVNPVADFSLLVSGTNVKLVNVADGTQASATVTVTAGEIKLTGMSIKVLKDTTANFKILADTKGDLTTTFTGANNKLMLTVAVKSASSSSSFPIIVDPYTTLKNYVVSVIPPTVTLVKKSANVFLATITNADADVDITLDAITAQVRPVSVANNNYSAVTCIRDEGSSDKCDLATSGTGAVPGAAKTFTFGAPINITKNSNVTREIFVDSNFVSPSDLQGEITALLYNTSVSETYSVVAQ